MDPVPSASRLAVVVPCALAFLASACVMAVEIAAGRLMAASVGAGLYTWTSVIGVILAGITVGNAVGGRIADRFPTRKALSSLFLASSFLCLALPLLHSLVARWCAWDEPSETSLPLRIALHVVVAFLLPATALGLLGPVIAKEALDQGHARGQTVGTIYAWGALGSILGTFAAGFYLVPTVGTGGLLVGVAAVLALTAILLAPRTAGRLLLASWPGFAGVLVGSLLAAGRGTGDWVYIDGALTVREKSGHECIYVAESPYSYVRVAESRDKKERRLVLDNLVHAMYSPGKPDDLMYDYEKIYAAITYRVAASRRPEAALFFGGGGYVFPRYVRKAWPECRVQVAEIDPGVTLANFAAFGLSPAEVRIREGSETRAEERQAAIPRPIEVFHLDARNHVEDLVRGRTGGGPFDLVYGDAFNDYCVPFHLVTREFGEKVKALLRPGTGIYLVNVIDIFQSGEFLGAIRNTLGAVFPKVLIFTATAGGPSDRPTTRSTFVVLAAMGEVDLEALGTRPGEPPFTGSLIGPEHLRALDERSRGLILTDDHSPVENLLDVVVRRRNLTERSAAR